MLPNVFLVHYFVLAQLGAKGNEEGPALPSNIHGLYQHRAKYLALPFSEAPGFLGLEESCVRFCFVVV